MTVRIPRVQTEDVGLGVLTWLLGVVRGWQVRDVRVFETRRVSPDGRAESQSATSQECNESRETAERVLFRGSSVPVELSAEERSERFEFRDRDREARALRSQDGDGR